MTLATSKTKSNDVCNFNYTAQLWKTRATLIWKWVIYWTGKDSSSSAFAELKSVFDIVCPHSILVLQICSLSPFSPFDQNIHNFSFLLLEKKKKKVDTGLFCFVFANTPRGSSKSPLFEQALTFKIKISPQQFGHLVACIVTFRFAFNFLNVRFSKLGKVIFVGLHITNCIVSTQLHLVPMASVPVHDSVSYPWLQYFCIALAIFVVAEWFHVQHECFTDDSLFFSHSCLSPSKHKQYFHWKNEQQR